MKIPWDKIWVNIKRAWIIFDTIMTILWDVLGKLFWIMLDTWELIDFFIFGSKRRKRK